MCACVTLVRSVISDCIRIIILFSDYFLHYVWPSVHHYFLCLVLSVLLLSQSEPVHQFSQELSTDIQLSESRHSDVSTLVSFSSESPLLETSTAPIHLVFLMPHKDSSPSSRSRPFTEISCSQSQVALYLNSARRFSTKSAWKLNILWAWKCFYATLSVGIWLDI